MSRNALASLLPALLALPSAAANIELGRLDAVPTTLSAPVAAVSAAGLNVSYLSGLSPSALTGPYAVSYGGQAPIQAPAALALPLPAPLAAPALRPAALAPLSYTAQTPQHIPYVVSVRGPPAQPRTLARVADTVAQTVRSWGAPVEDILDTHDVLLMGENHASLDSVMTLTRELPRLAAAGVTTVGIEGLKRPNQAALDAWLSGRTNEFPDAALDFSPARRQVFRALMIAARREGVRVVALGLPLSDWARAAAELAARKTGRPAADFPHDVNGHFELAGSEYIEGYNEAVAEVFLTRRNETMASFIAQAIKGGGKAVVLVGQAHVDGLDMVPGLLMNAPGDWGTMARELAGHALKAFSLTQTGGLFVNEDAARLDRSARPRSYRLAAEKTRDGAAAFVPLGPDSGLWHAGGRIPVPGSSRVH